MRILVLLLIAGFLAATPAMGQTRVVPDNREQITLSYAPLVRQAAPAVVNIYATRIIRERAVSPLFNDPFFRRFFGGMPMGPMRERRQNSLGSGVIVRPDGLIVTNHHVIDAADQIKVVLNDGREFHAELLLSDEETDLAVLKVDPGEALPYLEPAPAGTLEVGDLVLAIGNPFGVGQTVTSGIVSALARSAGGISDYSFFIQTDAAINPGNSGGALVAMDGSLVGINTAIFSRSGGSLGIGFAIPASMVRAVIDSVDNGGRIVRPWLGMGGQDVTGDIARSLSLPRPGGVLVNRVEPGSPADRAGIRLGDIVMAVNGREVAGAEALRFHVATLPMGEEAELTVLRDGEELTLDLPVEPPPENPPRDVTTLGGRQPFAGAVVANLSPALIDEIDYEGGVRHGVIVLDIRPRSPADRLNLRPADIIREVNGAAVATVDDLERLMAAGARAWQLAIQRDERVLEVMVHG